MTDSRPPTSPRSPLSTASRTSSPGKSARGVFHVPAAVRAFPACLVAEAVGQLAAWVSMEHIDYRGRPVAALAGETRFLGDVAPGDTLQLAVDIDDVDDDAVSYRGWADVDGERVIELNDCLGPMLPVDGFRRAGRAARALCAAARRGRDAGSLPGRRRAGRGDRRTRSGQVDAREAQDSRRPHRSLPTTSRAVRCFRRRCCSIRRSACHAHLRARPAPEPAGRDPVPARMTHVKMRSFIVPGQEVDTRPKSRARSDGDHAHRLSARDGDGRTIATARVEFADAGAAAAMTARKRVAITGLGLVTPVGNDVATTWDAVLHGRSGGAPIASFDASGFPVHIAAEVKNFDALAADRRPQAAEAHQPFASLRARGGGAGAARRRHPSDRRRRHAMGLHARRRHDGRGLRGPGRHAGAFGRRRRAARRPAADRRPGQRSARVLPQQLRGGLVADHAPARHSRLRVGRAHGLRVRRPGAGHGR